MMLRKVLDRRMSASVNISTVVLATALFGGLPSVAGLLPADCVTGGLTVAYETKVLSYGLPDSDDPNFLPYGYLTLFDAFSVGSRFYIDTSHIGERMGRGDRAWDFWEIDFPAELRHSFTPDEFAWLPTSVELGAGYRYEYHPPRTHIRDTQFWVADMALQDLWLVPRFSYERDVIRDNGTYLNLALSHDFKLMEGLTLTPTVWQGWGDEKRIRGYLSDPSMEHPLNRAGLMDTRLQLSFAWTPFDWLTASAFVAYSDFLFDRHIRDASRNYIRQIDGGARNRSWCFPVGVSCSVMF